MCLIIVKKVLDDKKSKVSRYVRTVLSFFQVSLRLTYLGIECYKWDDVSTKPGFIYE